MPYIWFIETSQCDVACCTCIITSSKIKVVSMTRLSSRVYHCIRAECLLTSFIIPRLAPDTRPVTRTAWAELFDLVFRKPTHRDRDKERGQHCHKTSLKHGRTIFCRHFNLYLNCRTQSFKNILKTNWNITNWPLRLRVVLNPGRSLFLSESWPNFCSSVSHESYFTENTQFSVGRGHSFVKI